MGEGLGSRDLRRSRSEGINRYRLFLLIATRIAEISETDKRLIRKILLCQEGITLKAQDVAEAVS